MNYFTNIDVVVAAKVEPASTLWDSLQVEVATDCRLFWLLGILRAVLITGHQRRAAGWHGVAQSLVFGEHLARLVLPLHKLEVAMVVGLDIQLFLVGMVALCGQAEVTGIARNGLQRQLPVLCSWFVRILRVELCPDAETDEQRQHQ